MLIKRKNVFYLLVQLPVPVLDRVQHPGGRRLVHHVEQHWQHPRSQGPFAKHSGEYF